MIKFIIFIIFILPFTAESRPVQFQNPLNDMGSFNRKAVCETVTGGSCYRSENCPVEICSLVSIEVPDLSLPIVETITQQEECSDPEQCEIIIESSGFCADQTNQKRYGDLNDDGQLWAYCFVESRPTKTIQVLEEDPVKIAARDDAIVERDTKRSRLSDIKTTIVSCARNTGDYTPNQVYNCIRALSRETVIDRLQSGEL